VRRVVFECASDIQVGLNGQLKPPDARRRDVVNVLHSCRGLTTLGCIATPFWIARHVPSGLSITGLRDQ
jgi:hypothetical protein